MIKQALIAVAVFAVSAAGAETFRVTLGQPSVIKGTEFKAGDYSLNVKDNVVVILKGKQKVEVPATVESVDKKFKNTKILYSEENGKYLVKEIQVGGTKTKLLFDSGVQAAGGGQ